MFFDRIKAGSDRFGPSQKIGNSGFFASIFGAGRTESGADMSAYLALNLPAVYCAVGIIADGIAQLPIDVFQKNADGTSAEVGDHPLAAILNGSANDYMTSFVARQTQLHHTLLWGNGYQEIERNAGGDVVGLWPLLPDHTKPMKPTVDQELYYSTTISGRQFNIPMGDVLHLPALGYDGYCGYSPVTVARQSLGLTSAMQTFGAKFFGNDAKSGGFIMHPGKLSDGAQENIKKSIEKQGGLDNANRIKVLEEGAKFIQTTLSPEDSQFLGSRVFQISEIARIFRVPLPLLQSTEKSTSFGTGMEQLMIGFVVWTLTPWIVRLEQEMKRKLFTDADIKKGLYFKFNLNALLRGDAAARAAFYQQAVGRPWMSPNEARAFEDMNPKPGLDEVSNPLNMGGNSKDPAPAGIGHNKGPALDDENDNADNADSKTGAGNE